MKERRMNKSTLQSTAMTALVILFFLGVIIAYYIMLHSQTRDNIIKSGELSTATAVKQIDKYLSNGINTINLVSYTLDNMLRSGASQEQMHDFLVNQTSAILATASADSTGLYGYIGGGYLDGTDWVPDDDYIPTERPWYIEAMANTGSVAVVDPYIDAQTKTVIITFSKTLCDSKSVAAMDLSLAEMQTITKETAKQGGLECEIVLDRNYQVIAHSDINETGKSYLEESGSFGHALVGKLRSASDHIFSLQYEGSDYIVYAVPLSNDWLCLSVFNATSAFSQLRRIFLFTICASVMVVLILLFIMIRSRRRALIARQFEEKSQRAVAASRAKSSFLANMSHEIRTPINVILGMNELILRKSHEDEILEYADNIQVSGKTLLALVNTILDFSKIEDGKMEILPVHYDTASMINNLVISVQERIRDKGLAFKVEVDETLPQTLCGDDIRISQIIMNLLTNAVKYTEKGTITFTVKEKSRMDDDLELYVSVRDTGIGIRREDLAKLTEPFERIEEKRNRNIEGTGLGMAIVNRLLPMMGSRLRVDSVYGEGSDFSFTLHQKIIDSQPMGNYAEQLHHSVLQRDPGAGSTLYAPDARILVVDDNEMNLKVAYNLMKLYGIKSDLVSSGADAIEMVRKNDYDIIFMDHMMPEMDGIETLREMHRQNLPRNKAVVIALTANAIVGAKERYLNAGFDDYMSKPIEILRLQDQLVSHLPGSRYSFVPASSANKPHAPGTPMGADGASAARGVSPAPSPDHDDPGPGKDSGTARAYTRGSYNNGNVETAHAQEEPDGMEKVLAGLAEGGIHTGDGLKYAGGNYEFYLENLMGFSAGAQDKAAELRSDYDNGDLHSYHIHVHALKGNAKMIGANELSSLALKQENAAKAADSSIIDDGIDGLLDTLSKTAAAIRASLDARNTAAAAGDSPSAAAGAGAGTSGDGTSPSGQLPEIDPALLRQKLDEAARLIDSFEAAQAEHILKSLSSFSFRQEPLKTALKDILAALNDFDTEKAAKLLNEMMVTI